MIILDYEAAAVATINKCFVERHMRPGQFEVVHFLILVCTATANDNDAYALQNNVVLMSSPTQPSTLRLLYRLHKPQAKRNHCRDSKVTNPSSDPCHDDSIAISRDFAPARLPPFRVPLRLRT